MTMNPPRRLHCRYWGREFLTNSVQSLMTQTGGDFQAESVELNDLSTVSSEPPDIDTS